MARYEQSNRQSFVNPYNFVPVDLKKTKRTDVTKKNEERLTGYLDCLMECKTHMAIPDVDNRIEGKVAKHYEYPFFGMTQGTPKIPGSSIRGTIRNIYETITDSCFGTVEKDTIVTTRSGQSFQPGLLVKEKESWKLYKATRHLLKDSTTNLMQHSGEKVYFEAYKKGNRSFVKEFDYKPMGRGSEGYLCIGEKAPKRNYQSIFSKGQPETDYTNIRERDFQKLEAVLAVYRDENINKAYKKTHKGYYNYEAMKKNGVIPVYYNIQNKSLYLSFAALGRKAFDRTLDGMLLEKSHQKCDGRKNLCQACALFGTVEGEGLGSRVRFTEATCESFDEKKQLVKRVTFDELSSPRISYTPFYLKNSVENANWREGYDSKDLEIRGRKFYWHHEPVLHPDKEIPKTERNGTYDVVNPGTTFKFRVYFDGITKSELDFLQASIHLNENNINGQYCQKIGHGKPLGYGSVKIIVSNCIIRTFDTVSGWMETERTISSDKELYACSAETWNALKMISDLDANKRFGNIPIEYPSISLEQLSEYEKQNLKPNDNSVASHQWFTQNYKLGWKKPNSVLPEIGEAQKLSKYDILPYNKGQKGGKKW